MKFYKFPLVILLISFIFINFNLSSLNSISKNDTKPKIKIITPSKSEEYIISRPTIKVSFESEGKIKSIKLYLNNKDVTKNAKITKNSITYKPSKKLKKGNQIVKIVISDNSKNTTTSEWYFTVGTPIYKSFKGSFLYNLDKIKETPKDFYIISSDLNTSKEDLDMTKSKFVVLENINIYTNENKDSITIYKNGNLDKFKTNNSDLKSIYQKLFFNGDIICQFTPGTNNLSAFNYMKFSSHSDKIFSSIDVTNLDDNKNPFYLNIYNQALDNGYHIGPVSSKFCTKILASDLNKDSLLDGLKNRRTYVTNNDNLDLEFSINSYNMGSIIKNPSKLNFTISAIDLKKSNTIEKISVVSNNGRVIKSKNFNSNLVKYEFTLNEFEKMSYYYLFIYQNNDKITVSSPIWVDWKINALYTVHIGHFLN